MKTRKFDTKVQHLKYKVLREVARARFEGNLEEKLLDIPKIVMPGPKPTMQRVRQSGASESGFCRRSARR